MTFGINQFIHAIVYYALGKIAHAGGCHLPASCMLLIMLCVAHNLIKLDFIICRRETSAAILLQCGGPVLVSAAVFLWAIHRGKDIVVFLTCSAFFLQGIWLLFMLHICGVSCQDNGAMLPEKMRATFYLDIFGWLNKLQKTVGKSAWSLFGPALGRDENSQSDDALGRQYSHEEVNEFERNYQATGDFGSGLDAQDPRRTSSIDAQDPRRGSQLPASPSKSAFLQTDGRWKTSSASGEMPQLPDAFLSFQDGKEHEEFDLPGKIPAKVFRTATWAAALVWIVGAALPYFVFWSDLKFPRPEAARAT